MKNVPDNLYLPVMWFEAIGRVTPNSAQMLKTLHNLPHIVNIVGSIIVMLNLIAAICMVVRIYRISLKKEFKLVNNIEDVAPNSTITEKDTKGCEMKLLS